jgi:hypothetical protein
MFVFYLFILYLCIINQQSRQWIEDYLMHKSRLQKYKDY